MKASRRSFVEGRGGFVCHDEVWGSNEGSGGCHPLLLTDAEVANGLLEEVGASHVEVV